MATKPKLKKKSGFAGERFTIVPSEVIKAATADPRISDLYITAIGYFPQAQYHHNNSRESISSCVLIFCKEGKGWIKVGDKQKSQIEANQYILIQSGEEYSYGADDKDPWTIYWIYFDGTKAQLMCKDLNKPQKAASIVDSHAIYRIELFEEIYFMLGDGRDIERMTYASLCFHHLLATLTFTNLYLLATTKRRKPADNFVHVAISYMSEHIESTLSMNDLATKCGYSRSHFTHTFTKEMGMPPKEYFQKMKINRACLLLKNTNESIIEIAMRMGFGEGQYFSRTFKKIKGVTATQYRRQNKINK
jgi:AraC-like DNA-binding protein